MVPAQRLKPKGLVLLAGHDDDSREVLQDILGQHFDVLSARTVTDAIRFLKTSDIDVIVTDYVLGDGTGLDLLQKGSQFCPHMVVILLAESNDLLAVVAARKDRRIFRISLKPVDPSLLVGWAVSAKVLSQMRRSGTRRKVDS